MLKPHLPENMLRSLIPKQDKFILSRNAGKATIVYLVTSNFERNIFKDKFTDFIEIKLWLYQ